MHVYIGVPVKSAFVLLASSLSASRASCREATAVSRQPDRQCRWVWLSNSSTQQRDSEVGGWPWREGGREGVSDVETEAV